MSGRHELISDEYYDWYVNHDCTHGIILHFCSGRAGQCRARLEPGDQRELIHVGKWRLVTPALCLRQAYTQKLGVELGLEAPCCDQGFRVGPGGGGFEERQIPRAWARHVDGSHA